MNDIMLEKMLKSACQDAERLSLSLLPDDDSLDYEFTDDFDSMMEPLVKKSRRFTYRYRRAIKYVAALVIVAFSMTMFNSGVVDALKVKIYNFIMSSQGDYTHINMKGESELDKVVPALPEYVPEGYSLYKTDESDWSVNTIYGSDELNEETGRPKSLIMYNQSLNKNTGMAVGTNEEELKPIVVKDTEGYYGRDAGRCLLLWRDEDYNYFLTGPVELDELLEMANSIK